MTHSRSDTEAYDGGVTVPPEIDTSSTSVAAPYTRAWQLIYMAAVTLLATIFVLILRSNAPENSIPKYYWGLEAFVIIGCVACAWDVFWSGWIGRDDFGNPYRSLRMERWSAWRERSGHGNRLVMVGVGLNMVAFWLAVKYTGGGIGSPFAPLFSAPAIFGTFVAYKWQGIAELVVLASVVTFLVYWKSPHTQGADWWPSATFQVALLCAAGGINIGQKVRADLRQKRA